MGEELTTPRFSDVTKEHKFNLGLSTLEEIHQILVEIRKITINISDSKTMQNIMPQGKAQHMKYRLSKQLLVRSCPLILKQEGEIERLNKIIEKIQIGWKRPNVAGDPFLSDGNVPIPHGCVEIYYPLVDNKLDEFVMDVETTLQKAGKSFMPTKGESSLF